MKKKNDNELKKFLGSYLRENTDTTEITLPTWAGTQALLSESQVPLMHVAFLPFLPHPVTEIATVYTAMQNYLKLLNQLEKKSLPIFCDEGVFRLVLNIYLKFSEEFKNLVAMLGGFHIAKCVQRCIGKFIKGTGLEDAFVETDVFGVKVMESILAATNYVRSLRGIQTLTGAIELVKWKAFWNFDDPKDFENSIQVAKRFAETLENKDRQNCLILFEKFKTETKFLVQQCLFKIMPAKA